MSKAKLNLLSSDKVQADITLKQQKDIRKIYNRTYKNLTSEIKKLEGKDNISSILRTEELSKLRTKVRKEYKAASSQVKTMVEGNMETISKAVVEDNIKFVKQIGMPIQGAYHDLPKEIVNNISMGRIYQEDWTLSKSLWGHDQKKLKEIDLIIAEGIAQNKGSYDIAKDLEAYVNPEARKNFDWSKVNPRSSKQIDYNAQRLARTLTHHAYQQAVVETSKPNPFVEGIRWLSAHSERTCELCISRESEDNFGLGPGVYPKDAVPLDHPNGLCTHSAVITKSMEEVADRLADWALGGEDSELDQWANKLYGTDKFDSIKKEIIDESRTRDLEKERETFARNVDENLNNQKQKGFETKLNGMFKELESKLTNYEGNSIQAYTGQSYREMNGILRGTYQGDNILKSRYERLIDGCESGLNKAILKETMYVRRGVSPTGFAGMVGKRDEAMKVGGMKWVKQNMNNLIGAISEDKGFLSTSPILEKGFVRPIEMRIELPAGAKAAYISPISEFKNEKEMLIQKGTRYLISKVEEDGAHGNITVYMKAILDN